MSTTTTIRREAPFLEEFQRNLLQGAFDATKSPGTVTPREVAGLTALQTGAIGQTAAQMGIDPTTGALTGQPAFGGAFDVGQGTMAMGIPALQMAQQQYDPTSGRTQQFMNQYQSDVTQEALKQMDAEAQKAQNQLEAQAQQVGAFGGSRMGVQSAELSKNLQDIKSKRIFEDLSKNFMQAQQQAIGTSEANRARQLQAAQTYGSLGQGIGQIGQTQAGQAQAMGNLGAQQAQLGAQGVQSLLGVGQVGRTRDQAMYDELFRYASGQAMEPRQRIQFGSDILAGVPSVQQSMSQQALPYTNPLAAGVGAGITGVSALSNFYGQ